MNNINGFISNNLYIIHIRIDERDLGSGVSQSLATVTDVLCS